MDQYIRTELLLGKESMEKLKKSRVAVFGLGGVGGYVVEALARSGVGALDIIDNDTISPSNINRQIIATRSTVGSLKTDVMKKRIEDIDPSIRVTAYPVFFLPDQAHLFPFDKFDYIVDAIDTVTSKLALVMTAHEKNIPIISSMGTGNKINPTMLEVADISRTKVCPLAKIMRKELKKRGISHLKCVYSKERPLEPNPQALERCEAPPLSRRSVPGSTAFVPSVAGMIIAGEVVKDLTGCRNDERVV